MISQIFQIVNGCWSCIGAIIVTVIGLYLLAAFLQLLG